LVEIRLRSSIKEHSSLMFLEVIWYAYYDDETYIKATFWADNLGYGFNGETEKKDFHHGIRTPHPWSHRDIC
jgi:hypothetical protein